MLAFHSDLKIKKKYLKRVKNHRLADEIIQGTGWENGKGCAVGCTLEVYDHSRYPIELGIPVWLANVEDKIFEGLPKEKAILWPEQFLRAIKPGIDLSKAFYPFLITVVESVIDKYDKKKHPEINRTICTVLDLLKKGETDENKLRDAASAASYAAFAASNAASNAAYAAFAAFAASNAAYAASYAAYAASNEASDAASNAAYAASYAASSAASNAASAASYAASYAASSAASAASYLYFSDELIKILEGIQ